MLHARNHLELCHTLLKKEHEFRLKPGLRIGRGFADIGFEEYSVLSGYNVISLHTGKSITLEPDFPKFYFPIYTIDEMSRFLYEQHCDIAEIRYDDQRTWVLKLSPGKSEAQEFESDLLETAFLKAFLWSMDRACTA